VDEESIKAAEGLGITSVQVKDITEALKEIQKLTGIEVRNSDPKPRNSHYAVFYSNLIDNLSIYMRNVLPNRSPVSSSHPFVILKTSLMDI